MINQRYDLETKIINGEFGQLFIVNDTQEGQRRKLVDKVHLGPLELSQQIDAVDNALKIINFKNHPFFVQYLDDFSDKNAFYVFAEYCNGGLLSDFLNESRELQKKIQFENLLNLIAQMLCALMCMREKLLLHQDIKSTNIFLHDDVIKIGFFGGRRLFNKTQVVGSKNMLNYNSPEILSGLPNSFATDVWATAIVIYELCTYDFPFRSAMQILKGDANDLPAEYPVELNTLIKRMLEKDPNQRFTVYEAAEYFEKFYGFNIKADSYTRNNVMHSDSKKTENETPMDTS